jgi:hypothetical protein
VPALSADAATEVERTRTAIDALERTLAPHALQIRSRAWAPSPPGNGPTTCRA